MANYLYYDYLHSAVCKVKEDEIESVACTNVDAYLNALCIKKGSTLKGRRLSMQQQMHIKRYVPVVVDKETIYFPIHPIHRYDCIWVFYPNIESITYQKKMCIIHFRDHTHLKCLYPQRVRRNCYLIRQYLQML
ncbi:MAG: competence protein ComK [Erysipelotrichaceae bacterium]|nr:competence protein ComK [Erysipelotrichaceae bacterium]